MTELSPDTGGYVIKQKARLLVALLSLATCSAHALERVHFKGMAEKDLYYVLTAFQKVNVHYLVAADGSSIIAKIGKPSPKIREATNYGVLLYFNPADAENARIGFEKSNGEKAQVRTARASKIIEAQFARRNSGASRGTQEPDFIILLSAAPKLDVIEYLSEPNRPVSFKAKDGKEVVSAFLDRSKAMQLQSSLQAKGAKVDRIGLDERSFLEFILAQAKQGRLVLVYGY